MCGSRGIAPKTDGIAVDCRPLPSGKNLAGLARRAFDYDLLNAPGEIEKWRHSYNFVWDHGEYWVLQAIDAAGLRGQMRKGLLARIFGCR